MNKFVTIIALIALAMLAVSPASADGVWHNEKYFGTQEALDEYLDGAKVIHNPKTGVDSKYRDTNPAKSPEVYAGQNSCYLECNIRAGYNTLTKEVLLSNVLAPDTSITIPILPDGTFRYDGLAHGEYTLYIDDGNGGQPEYSRVICNGNGVVRPVNELLGHAVSGDPAKVEAEPTQTACVKKTVDVTNIVRGLVYRNELHIDADYDHLHYNALFGDPDYGTLKELRVVYKYTEEYFYGWYPYWKLNIKSAEYGTFCEDTKVPCGYHLKSVMEDEDIDITKH